MWIYGGNKAVLEFDYMYMYTDRTMTIVTTPFQLKNLSWV